MRAARYQGDHRVTVDNIPVPSVDPSEGLIAPEYLGVCGTDAQHRRWGVLQRASHRHRHEIGGRVVKIGSAVRKLKVGDLVSAEPHHYCGACVYCQTGHLHMCLDRRAPGVHLDGGMAASLLVDETIAYTVAGTEDARRAALTEPLA